MPRSELIAFPLPHPNRRWFLTVSAAALALPVLPRSALALATGTHSFTQGEVEVTVLSDGTLTLPKAVLAPAAPPEELYAALMAFYGSVPETITAATNVTLLKSGSDLILVDNGSGKGFQDTAGKLMENLAANGIDPTSITKMLITHAHPDHVFGTLLDDGTPAFPNAAFLIGQTEYDFWMDPDLITRMPAEMHGFVLGAQKQLGAMQDRLTLLQDGEDVAPGVSVLATPGHTPGHMSVMVEGDGGLLLTGDVMNSQAISLPHPDWAFGFDADGAMAATTRRAVLERVAADGMRLLAYHFVYPGTGRVEKAGDGYSFIAGA
jgi:glyoxylase-like metal-dependent hydrolase (beta-lactamase superfamily II)